MVWLFQRIRDQWRNSVGGSRRRSALQMRAVWSCVQVQTRLGETPALRVWRGTAVLVPSLSLQGETEVYAQDACGSQTLLQLVACSSYTKHNTISGMEISYHLVPIVFICDKWMFSIILYNIIKYLLM